MQKIDHVNIKLNLGNEGILRNRQHTQNPHIEMSLMLYNLIGFGEVPVDANFGVSTLEAVWHVR